MSWPQYMVWWWKQRLADAFGDVIDIYAKRLNLALIFQQIFDSLLIIVLAALVISLAGRVLKRIVRRVDHVARPAYRRKIETIGSLLLSTLKYTVYIAASLWILVVWGVPKDSLVVGSAVVGAAIGFGSQGLVQDVITGLSILAEEQLAVGDFVEISGKSGAVEEVGLRVVKLRDHLGVQHVIFNRNISMVSNFTSGTIQALVDIALAGKDTAEQARKVAEQVCRDIASELPYFPQTPHVEGIQETSTGETFLRIHVRVLPQQEAQIRDIFVDRIKHTFAIEKIPIPGDRVRVIIVSDLFKKAINRVQPVTLKSGPEKTFEGAV